VQSPETIQIGSFIVSKAAFDAIVPFIAALIGTLVGGLTTYLATNAAEKRKWERETTYELMKEQREAIASALEWIAPLKTALTAASLRVSGLRWGRIDPDDFRRDWPRMAKTLSSMEDPPARLQAVLPPYAYERSLSIARGLEDLGLYHSHELAIDSEEGIPSKEDWEDRFKASTEHIVNLRKILEQLEKDLIEDYRKTFK
jgi:hypothetical protein